MGFLLCWVSITQCFAKGYQTFEENGKIGMKDEAGHVVLPPSFEALGWSDGNFSVVGEVTGYRLNGLWGIIDLKKKFVTRADYESLVYCGGDCVAARKKINPAFSKTGCINLKGEIKIPFDYDGISLQGLRAVVFNIRNGRYNYGLADLSNRLLIPVVYGNIRPLGTLRFAVENAENKMALFGDDGKAITDFSIDSISSFYKSFAIVYQNQLQGLIDRDGIVKLEVKYSAIKIDEEGKVFAQLPNEWSFINDKNETGTRYYADELKSLNGRKFIVRKGNVSGIADLELNTIVPIEFESISEIEPEKYLAKRNGKLGVVAENRNIVIPFSFDSIIFDNDFYRVLVKNLGWKLVNRQGKELTGKYYEKLSHSNPLGFPAISDGFFGIVDTNGNEFIHCVFDSIAEPIAGLVGVKFKGQYGIINAGEDWLVAPQAFPLSVINEHRYLQRQPGNNFIKSYSGEIIYFTPNPIKFDTKEFTELLSDGKEKIISLDGTAIQDLTRPEDVDQFFPESEGLRGILKDGRYGFVDKRGKLRIANRYDSIGKFHEGLAAVKLIGKWGFVNTGDQIVINPNYDHASYFKNSVAVISRNKKFGLINKEGETILSARYDNMKEQPDHKFLLISSGLQGLADEKGNVLVEPRFDYLENTVKGLLIVCYQGKCGAITAQGLSIIPMIYAQLTFDPVKNSFLAKKKSEWKEVSGIN
jgi:hypothetical protein